MKNDKASNESDSSSKFDARHNKDYVMAQLERILLSSFFQNSKRYGALLRHIVKKTLAEECGDLKERFIGHNLFGRSIDYDTGNDPIVRVSAAEVRKRLQLYYTQEEHKKELQIRIPVRSYHAEFCNPEPAPLAQEQLTRDCENKALHNKLSKWRIALLCACALFVIAPVLLLDQFQEVFEVIQNQTLYKWWKPFTSDTGTTLICISNNPHVQDRLLDEEGNSVDSIHANTPYYLYSGLTRHGVSVSVMDMDVANGIIYMLSKHKKSAQIVPAAWTVLSEYSKNPVIFIGLENQWGTSMNRDLRFSIHYDGNEHGLRWINDKSSPNSRIWSLDPRIPYTQVEDDYVLVTRLYDSSANRWVLSIVGLSGLGTMSIGNLLLDQQAIASIQKSFPHGWDKSNMQLVFDVKVVQGKAGNARICSYYLW